MRYGNQVLTFLAIFSFLKYVDSAKLLGIFPFPAGSHYLLASKLMKGLAEAGHDVTMVSPYETKDWPKNGTYRDVVLTGLDKKFKNFLRETDLFEDYKQSSIGKLKSYSTMVTEWLNQTMFHPNLRALLDSNAEFDAILMEIFMNEAHFYFAHHYKCPLIIFTSMAPNPWVNDLVANPSPPSYIPYHFNDGDISEGMTFYQRTYNLYYTLSDYLFRAFYWTPQQNLLLHQAFPNAPNIEDFSDYVSLILLNSHTSYAEAVPVVPNMVEIGGYHVEPPKKLPQDLQEFLDGAKDGAIYFSMGSNLRSKDMTEERKAVILNVLGNLKQKVLWKFEDEKLPGKPDNVLIKNWMPQQEILAHPNVKLFITHGGLLSTIETIYHGVPILVLPVFADQFLNANIAVLNGYGLKLSYHDENFSEATLTKLIQELLSNPKYRETAQERSRSYHDRPMNPMETARYWVDYVVRYKGAPHLKVAGTKLPWYKYLMLDVILFLVFVVYLSFYIVKLALKRLLCKNKKAKKTKIN